MTTSYQDLAFLINQYNLTGNLTGTLPIPNITLSQDSNSDYLISYSHFTSYLSISNSSYYDANDVEPQHIIDADDYNTDIQNAINSILNPTSDFSVLFSDVANINFQEETNGEGIITFAQMNYNNSTFSSISSSASTYLYSNQLDNPSQRYGDIWINMEHDATEGNTFAGYNIWEESGNITPGTRAYKVLMEEISHSLGVDIIDEFGVARNTTLDSHKYTVTSRNEHPDMYLDTVRVIGFPNDSVVANASTNPFPTGLGLFDIAALQEIYGANTDTRNEDMGFDDGDANTTGTTYKIGQGFGATKDDAFVYTIWDAGGITDTIDASGYDDGVQIDLREGHFSSIGKNGHPNGDRVVWDSEGYDAGNVAIAYGTQIERAIGTAHDDYFIGNDGYNSIDGGAGYDIVDYSNDPSGIIVGETAELIIDGHGGEDIIKTRLSSGVLAIEKIIGTDHDDIFYMNSRFDTVSFDAGEGHDTLVLDGGGQSANTVSNAQTKVVTNDLGAVFTGIDAIDLYSLNTLYIEKSGHQFANVQNHMAEGGDLSYQLQGAGITADLNAGIITGDGGQDVFDPAVEYTIVLTGTQQQDNFIIDHGVSSRVRVLTLSGGLGDDVVSTNHSGNAMTNNLLVYKYDGGHDTVARDVSDDLSIERLGDGNSGISNISAVAQGNDKYDVTIHFDAQNSITVTGIDGNVSNDGIHSFSNFFGFNQLVYENDVLSWQYLSVTTSNIPDLNNIVFSYHTSPTTRYEGSSHDDVIDFSSLSLSVSGATFVIDGGFGDDAFMGSSYDDHVELGFGNDTFDGSNGNDIIYGGAGNDILSGGAGSDGIYAGGGDDTITHHVSQNVSTTDYYYAGAGNDTLNLVISSADYLNYRSNIQNYMQDLSQGTEHSLGFGVFVDGVENVEVTADGVGAIEIGTDQADVLQGTSDVDVLEGLEGDDMLSGYAGNDTLFAGAGNDALIGGAGDDVLDGGTGADIVDYSSDTGAISVDFDSDTATDGSGGTDDFISVEGVIGSNFGDTFSLSVRGQDEWIDGGAGADHVTFTNSASFTRGRSVFVNSDGTLETDRGALIKNVESFSHANGSTAYFTPEELGHNYQTSGFTILNYMAQTDGITANLQTGTISNVTGTDTFSSSNSHSIFATNANDNVTLDNNTSAVALGLGNDVVIADTSGFSGIYYYGGGHDVLRGDDAFNARFRLPTDVNENDISLGFTLKSTIQEVGTPKTSGDYYYDIQININGYGSITLEDQFVTVTYDAQENPVSYDVTAFNGLRLESFVDGERNRYTFNQINSVSDPDVITPNTSTSFLSDFYGSTLGDIIDLSASDDNYDEFFLFAGDDDFTGTSQGEDVYLDLGDDVARGLGGNDFILGGFGNDLILGGAGDDIIRGGADNDRIFYTLSDNSGSDLYYGGSGEDTVILNFTNAEYLVYEDEIINYQNHIQSYSNSNVPGGNSFIFSFGLEVSDFENVRINITDNFILGTIASENITGTTADDLVAGLNGVDIIDGGDGIDTADYSHDITGVTVNLHSRRATDGWGNEDRLYNIENVIGSNFNDILVGDNQNDNKIEGLDGHDQIQGRAGNDHLIGGNGNDDLNGHAGDDILEGGAGSDILQGSTGNDILLGGAGNDLVLQGGDGDDIIDGGDGHDKLRGQNGNDTLIGGDGIDRLDGEAGIDTADFSGAIGAVVTNLATSNTTDDGFGNRERIVRIENVIGSDHNDTLLGSDLDNVFEGGSGNDNIKTYGGNDMIKGEEGNDLLYGGDGLDQIFGGNGLDALFGQGGADTFVFEEASAYNDRDNVKDFSLAEGDMIDLSDLLGGYDPLTDLITDFVQITDNGTHSYVSVDADGSGTASTFQQVAQISFTTGLTDEVMLEVNGTIIT